MLVKKSALEIVLPRCEMDLNRSVYYEDCKECNQNYVKAHSSICRGRISLLSLINIPDRVWMKRDGGY